MPINIAPGVKVSWTSSNFDSHLILNSVSETHNAELVIEARVKDGQPLLVWGILDTLANKVKVCPKAVSSLRSSDVRCNGSRA